MAEMSTSREVQGKLYPGKSLENECSDYRFHFSI